MKKQIMLLLATLSFGATISNAQNSYTGGLIPFAMKQAITLLFLLLFVQHKLYAQNTFAPVGASWHYMGKESMYDFLAGLDRPNTFWNHHVKSVKDTTLDGVNCRKLIVTQIKRVDSGAAFNDSSRTIFVYDNTDTVFFYADDVQQFEPLYIFNVSEGDTVRMPYFDLPGQPFTYIVDSIRAELFDTSHLKSFYTHLISMPADSALYSANWGFANIPDRDHPVHKGKYTEKAGGLFGFFPTKCPIGAVGGVPLHEAPCGNLKL